MPSPTCAKKRKKPLTDGSFSVVIAQHVAPAGYAQLFAPPAKAPVFASATAKYAPTSRIFACLIHVFSISFDRRLDSPRQRPACRRGMPPPCAADQRPDLPGQEIIEHARREEHRAAGSRRCASNHDASFRSQADVGSSRSPAGSSALRTRDDIRKIQML